LTFGEQEQLLAGWSGVTPAAVTSLLEAVMQRVT
jgi:hypothetical protein